MTWYTPTVLIGSSPAGQVPYFIGPRTHDISGAQRDGFALGGLAPLDPSHLPPPFTPGSTFGYTVDLSTSPQNLTAVRVYFARTGVVSSANLLVSVWHSTYDFFGGQGTAIDFTSLTPDAIATIPLASLPLVSAANNYQYVALPPYTEAAFNPPVRFTGPAYPFITFHLDSGFSAVSNVVVGVQTAPTQSFATSDNLDFTNTITKQWHDLPGTSAKSSWPDLNFEPVARRGRSYAQVIG